MVVLKPALWRTCVSLGFLVAAATPVFAQGELPEPPGKQSLAPTLEELSPTAGQPPAALLWGTSTALLDDVVLIGAPGYGADVPSIASEVGRVALFTRNVSGVWVRSGTLEPHTRVAGDHFGSRVALGKRFALVASDRFMYVFERAAGQWHEVARLVPNSGEQFEGGLAVVGNELLIGALAGDAHGLVYVLVRRPDNTWHRVQTLRGPRAGSAGDVFGQSLQVAQGTLVVGAPGANDGRGVAFVYQQFGPVWVPYARLQAPASATGTPAFGSAVAVHGNRIAVGAPGANPFHDLSLCEFTVSGTAYVFVRHRWRWILQQKVAAEPCDDSFASAIALDDRFLAAGIRSPDRFEAGGARVFEQVNGVYQPKYFTDNVPVASPPALALDAGTLLLGIGRDPTDFDVGKVLAYDLSSVN